MSNIVIGIEGYVGAGKTSLCRELLNKIPNSILLHGGNFYRAIVYALIQKKENISLNNLAQNLDNINIKDLMDKLNVKFEIEDRETVVYVDDKKIDEDLLQSMENSMAVSIAGKATDNSHLYIFCM